MQRVNRDSAEITVIIIILLEVSSLDQTWILLDPLAVNMLL